MVCLLIALGWKRKERKEAKERPKPIGEGWRRRAAESRQDGSEEGV